MAKGQKRGNRELKKPKAVKSPPVAAPSALATRGMLGPNNLFKKKA